MPTGDAPTTSEWSTILLPTEVSLILEVWLHHLALRTWGHWWTYDSAARQVTKSQANPNCNDSIEIERLSLDVLKTVNLTLLRLSWLPGRCHAIIWTNAGILLIGLLGTNCNKILIEIYIFIQENAFEMSSGKWRPFCLRLNVLMTSHGKEHFHRNQHSPTNWTGSHNYLQTRKNRIRIYETYFHRNNLHYRT